MALQLEKSDSLPNGRLAIKAYKNNLTTAKGTSFGRVEAPSNRVNISNLAALITDRNAGIQPGMVSFVARLLHEETVRQLREGKNVEVLGLGTVFVATKGSMKGLKPGVADVPKMTLRFRSAKEIRKIVQSISAGSVTPVEIKPEINVVYDMKTKKVNEVKQGSVMQIKGKKLRVEGNSADIGLYLVKSDGSKLKIPADHIIRNDPSTLEVILPASIPAVSYLVRIVNQGKVKNVFSNTIREGVSDFKIEIKA